MRTLVCLLALSAISCFGAVTSENNERLRNALQKYPDADANKDGVLSLIEARAYRQKMKRGGAEQVGENAGEPAADKGPGYSGLYMGHSFFRPSAQALDQIVKETTIAGHKQQHVMAGGINGSPSKMWTNPDTRSRAKAILDSGDIELLVMTYFGEESSLVEHYSRWFDYAISRNPGVTFMVTIPWGKQLHLADQARLQELTDRSTQQAMTNLIDPLRKKYPDNKVLFCPYGLGAYELINRFNGGKLPGVKYVLDEDKVRRRANMAKQEALFRDETSHPNELVANLGALLWLQTLYDYDMSTLKPQTIKELPDIGLNGIAVELHKKIAPFNAIYAEKKD